MKLPASLSRSEAAVALPLVAAEEEEARLYRCTDGYLNAADIARAAGVSWKAARRAVDQHVRLTGEGRPDEDGAVLGLSSSLIPPPDTMTRAQLAEVVAQHVGIGRYRIRKNIERRAASRPPERKKEHRRMPTQDHPYRTKRGGRSMRNEEGGVVAVLTCRCGASEEIRFRKLCDSDVMDRRFKMKAWRLDPARCPGCGKKGKATMTTKPSAAAIAGQAKMFRLLQEHFDPDAGAYSADWSDKRVADESKLSVDLVSAVRDEAFGPLREPPELRQLKQDLATVEGLLAEEEGRVRSVRDMVEGLKVKAAELSKRFAA